MENNAHNCVLLWSQGKYSKTILFDAAMNTPIFQTLPSTSSYCTFVNTFMACKAPFFSREHVLQLPGHCWLDGVAPAPEEFVTEENVNFDKGDKQASEGVVHVDDNTIPAAN
jgi:hypothetical protein